MGNRDVEPNTLSYNSAINAWANTQDPNAGMHAEALLRRMEELSEMGKLEVKPDTTTYNTAITAWANSQDPNTGMRAEAILQRVENNTRWETKKSSLILSHITQQTLHGQTVKTQTLECARRPSFSEWRTIQDGKQRSQA
jgi:hypothetical protein